MGIGGAEVMLLTWRDDAVVGLEEVVELAVVRELEDRMEFLKD